MEGRHAMDGVGDDDVRPAEERDEGKWLELRTREVGPGKTRSGIIRKE